jgi:hypothetical protein
LDRAQLFSIQCTDGCTPERAAISAKPDDRHLDVDLHYSIQLFIVRIHAAQTEQEKDFIFHSDSDISWIHLYDCSHDLE